MTYPVYSLLFTWTMPSNIIIIIQISVDKRAECRDKRNKTTARIQSIKNKKKEKIDQYDEEKNEMND